jgi:hypothetical protein
METYVPSEWDRLLVFEWIVQSRVEHAERVEMKIGKGMEHGTAVVEFAMVLPLLVTILFGAIDFGFVSNDTTKLRQAVRETGRRASVWKFGRSVCDDSPAGEAVRGKLVQNHVVGSATPVPKPPTDSDAYIPSRILEARLLQCQLRLLAFEAGLDVRTKIVVASFKAPSTGEFDAVAASAAVLANGTCYPTPVVGSRHSGAIGRVFEDKNFNCIQDVGEEESDVSFTVVICAQYRTKSRTGFFGPILNDKILRSTVAMRVARLNAPPTPFYPGAVEEEPLTVDGKPGNWDGCKATAA